MINNLLTETLYNLKYNQYSRLLEKLKGNVYRPTEELVNEQNEALRCIIKFAFEDVHYYRELVRDLGISVSDIQSVNDLIRLPIIDKKTINASREIFFSSSERVFQWSSTGGSTGVPLRYRLDKECSMYARLVSDRSWGYAGYKPGDHTVIFAGGSLVDSSQNYKKKVLNRLANMVSFSSYGVDDDRLHSLYCYLQKNKPEFMYGYASSIYFFSLYLERNELSLESPPKAIFSTAEKLLPHQRQKIFSVMQTEVFDAYGLNDGGVSAHECECHNGFHIDFERAILEVVDEQGNQVKEGKGKVIATSLHNYAMPFVRYDTGDIATITHQPCECGKTTPRLMEIIGRITDYLKFGNSYIGSPVLTVLMGKLDLDLYQIKQDAEDHVIFKLVLPINANSDMKDKCVRHIRSSMSDRVSHVSVDIEFYDSVEQLGSLNKHKFIINETL